MSVGSTTRRSVQVSGFAVSRLLTPPRSLYPLRVPRTNVLPSASFRSPVARGTLAAQLTLPLVGCVKDFHLQLSAPCQAHDHRRSAPVSHSAKAPSGRTRLLCLSGVRTKASSGRRGLTFSNPLKLARPERFELPTSWFVGWRSFGGKALKFQRKSGCLVLNILAGWLLVSP